MNGENILVIRHAGLGDMLLTLSAVAPIKRKYPDSNIYFLANKSMIPLLGCFDFTEGTVEYARGAAAVARMIAQIRKLKIDWVINFERAFKKSLISLASGGRKRIGFNSIELSPFLTDRVPDLKDNPSYHMRDRYFQLTKGLGLDQYDILLPFRPDRGSRERVEDFLSRHGISGSDFLVGLNPVTGFPSKYWYNERWARVADYLIREKKAKLIITFGPEPGQKETAMDVMSRMRERAILSFDTSLIEFGALIGALTLFLCLDSGPFHFAVSQGTPTISLWGRGNLAQWGPQVEGHITIQKDVDCSPCALYDCDHRTCMQEITADDVIEKVDDWCERNFR
jgi:ADP-heptose:LPS heptosyltransferase